MYPMSWARKYRKRRFSGPSVVILPPAAYKTWGYLIMTEQASFGFVTCFGDIVEIAEIDNAAQFSTAAQAIEFAEQCGWDVINKKDREAVWF